MCVRVCVCVCARACVCMYVCVCVCRGLICRSNEIPYPEQRAYTPVQVMWSAMTERVRPRVLPLQRQRKEGRQRAQPQRR